MLFARATFKDALPEVSEALQKLETLATIWGVNVDEARMRADSLVDVGFFERRGSRERPEYWVPFLYRDALNMIQGTAEVEDS